MEGPAVKLSFSVGLKQATDLKLAKISVMESGN